MIFPHGVRPHILSHLQISKSQFVERHRLAFNSQQAAPTLPGIELKCCYLWVIDIALSSLRLELTSMHVIARVIRQSRYEKEQRPKAERHAATVPLVAVRAL